MKENRRDEFWEKQRKEHKKEIQERRELAERIRQESRSLLRISALGFFVASVLLTLTIFPILPEAFASLLSPFGGAFAVIISLYVFRARLRIGQSFPSKE